MQSASPAVAAQLSPRLAETLYRSMLRVRRVEEEIARVYPSDKIKSPVHLSIGQEPVSCGVCEALSPQDVVFGTYRGHAMYLAKGGSLRRMIAELFGKVDGCARGKGGSMHLVDVAAGVMGTSAVVGTTIPNAVGFSYAVKLKGEPRVVVSFFGDGATEEGVFYESLNFAALKRLPLLFVCENNGYAIHTHQSRRQADLDICARAVALGVPAERIQGNDVGLIHERAAAIVEGIRSGASGPAFIECETYRWLEHVGPGEDYGIGYRERAEGERWMARDPIRALGERLSGQRRAELEKEIELEIRDAFAFAEASPFPEAVELARHLYRE